MSAPLPLPTGLPPVNVLLVDDRADKLLALESILADGDHRVVTARSGAEALRALLREEFAVILLDVHMPQLDGFETASLIRRRPSSENTPIIFMTAVSDLEAGMSRGYALGAVDYIQLPVHPEVLKAKVAVFVELYRKRELLRQEAEARVTLLKAAEEERLELVREQEARRAAERENALKDQFLATLSHELRSPLTPILGWATMLRSGQLPEGEALHGLEVIERNARLQAQLIEDLLDVSRIVSGKLRMEMTGIDLRTVVEKGLEAVREPARKRGLRLRVDLDQAPVRVLGDPERLQQVVWNLASNAVKFAAEGGLVQVRVEAEEGQARLSVTDDGVGISEEFLPHVFERFRQAASGSTRVHGGLGLGLAIVKHIVEAHHGSARAESEGLGRGACMTVVLPLAKGAGTAPAPREPRADAEAAAAEAPLRGRTLLVVDDEEDAREMLSRALTLEGARVATAASLEAAVDCVEKDRPDLVLTDIGMPGDDGYAIADRLQGRWTELGQRPAPLVALTAYASPDDVARARAAGFRAHISKPIDPEAVALTLVAILRDEERARGGRPGA